MYNRPVTIESKGHVIDSYAGDTFFLVKGISGDKEARTEAFYALKSIFTFRADAVKEGTVGYAQYIDWEKNEAYVAYGEAIAPYGRAAFHNHIIILDLKDFEQVNCNLFNLNLNDTFFTHQKMKQLIKENTIKESLGQKLKVKPLPIDERNRLLNKPELRAMVDSWLTGTKKFYVNDANKAIDLAAGLLEIKGALSFSVNLPPVEQACFDPIILSVMGPCGEPKKPQLLTDILLSDRGQLVNELFLSLRTRPASYLRQVNVNLSDGSGQIEDAFAAALENGEKKRLDYSLLWKALQKSPQKNRLRVFNSVLQAMKVDPTTFEEDNSLAQAVRELRVSQDVCAQEIADAHPLNELLTFHRQKPIDNSGMQNRD